jgi:hypothetical protein
MPTFEISTKSGETIILTARSYMQARGDAHRKLKPGDSIDGIKTISVEKKLPAGFDIVRTICLANEIISSKMDEVESSYITYWTHKREFWMSKSEKEIDEMFPNRYNSRAYYRSEYYKLETEGAFTTSTAYYERWLSKIKREAKQAKEKSVWNMCNAIVKMAKNQPIAFFRVFNINKGKSGLEGMVTVNETTKRLFAIYAEGPIQRLHIRYLIK